jgi:hypothetical protein
VREREREREVAKFILMNVYNNGINLFVGAELYWSNSLLMFYDANFP